MSTFSGLVAIEAPHFTAGIVIDCERVKKAPLWLRYMECWTFEQLQKFVQDQHWKMVELERPVTPPLCSQANAGLGPIGTWNDRSPAAIALWLIP